MFNMKNCVTLSSRYANLQHMKHIFAAVTVLFCCGILSEYCECVVKIHSLHVPSHVENGTNSRIILDCVYTLDEKDDWQLVVKWWVNDDPVPIYQWIPELSARHTSPRYENKINLNYFIESGGALTKYRAINILSPTTDLSGVYKCDVSSMKSQASKESVMIVYAPPKEFDFNYTRDQQSMPARETARRAYVANAAHQTRPGAILMCDIKEVFPIPEVTIYRVDSDGTHPFLLKVDNNIQQVKSNSYRVRVSSIVNDVDLLERYGDQPSIFECLVTLPLPAEKKLFFKKQITYFPVVETPIFANHVPRITWTTTTTTMFLILVVYCTLRSLIL